MNIDILKDRIGVLAGELRASEDPAAQKRIKVLIDERQTIVDDAEAGA